MPLEVEINRPAKWTAVCLLASWLAQLPVCLPVSLPLHSRQILQHPVITNHGRNIPSESTPTNTIPAPVEVPCQLHALLPTFALLLVEKLIVPCLAMTNGVSHIKQLHWLPQFTKTFSQSQAIRKPPKPNAPTCCLVENPFRGFPKKRTPKSEMDVL